MKNVRILFLVMALAMTLTAVISADVPQLINYQGRLTDSSGEPVPDGTSSIHFAFFDDSIRGVLLWEETHPDVPILNGMFSVLLGSNDPIDPFQCNSFFDVYVEVTVGGGEPSSPRLRLAPVPSAMIAHSIRGDIETDEGSILVKNSDGDSLVYIGSGGRAGPGIYIFNPQPEPPGRPGINMTTDAASSQFEVGFAREGPDEIASVAVNADASHAGIVVTDAHSGDANTLVSLHANTGVAEVVIEFTPAVRGDGPSTEIRSTPDSGVVLMRGPRSAAGPEAPVIALVTSADSAKVGIGTAYPSEALYVVGNIVATGEIVSYTETKLKKNIEPIDNALNIIEGLRGMRYDWRRDEFKEYRLPEGRQVGFLAEDVEAVLPEIVRHDNNGHGMVAYNKITVVLVEAIKELRAENDELRKRIEQLEN